MPINKDKYPPNWDSEIRPRILERDQHKCVFCGVSNYAEGIRTIFGELVSDDQFMSDCAILGPSAALKYGDLHKVRIIKIVLTIAHLDHDEENWEVKDERLASLCQRCHLRYDAPEKKRRREKDQMVIDFGDELIATKQMINIRCKRCGSNEVDLYRIGDTGRAMPKCSNCEHEYCFTFGINSIEDVKRKVRSIDDQSKS